MAFTTSFSRRYACDRCRGHKLRCNRDLTASLESPCQRCRKAGAICTIGSGSSWRTPGQSKRRALPKDGPPADLVITLSPTGQRPRTSVGTQESAQSPVGRNNEAPSSDSVWNDLLQDNATGGLALDSIAWQEVFGPVTSLSDGHGEMTETAAALPTPTSATISPSKTSATHATGASNYRFDVTNIIRAHTTFDMASDPMPDTAIKETPTTTRKDSVGLKILDQPQSADDVQYSDQDTAMVRLAREQDFLRLEDDDHLWMKDQSSDTPAITFTTLNDQNIQALSKLGTTLMVHLHHIMEYRSTDSFVLAQSNTQCENTIGKMLQCSERFLDIIRSMNQPPRSEGFPFPDQSLDMDRGNYNSSESDGIPDISGDGIWTEFQPKSDLPCTFAILACYTCLLQIYEAVFSEIQQSLDASRSFTLTSVLPKVPSTIQGFHINGFMLQNHNTLQLKILIQVSRYMLDSIDKALRGARILEDSMFQALLKAGLQSQGRDMIGENTETGMGAVRASMKQIETRLR